MSTASPPPIEFNAARGWRTVAILFLLSTLSLMDRQVMSILIGPMKEGLHLTDFQVSVVVGLGFGLFYIVASVPIGWMVDKLARRPIIYAGVTIWSLATITSGLSTSMLPLFISRALVGAGEAALAPTAGSLIGDVFPRSRIAFPLAIYNLANSVGASLALVLGGFLLHWAMQQGTVYVPLLGELAPWQFVFVALGAPGMVLAFLAFVLPDPQRAVPIIAAGRPDSGANAGENTKGASEFLPFLRANKFIVICHFGTFALTALVVINILTWTPQYMVRSFGWDYASIGLVTGIILLAAPLVGSLSTGFLADVLYRRGVRDAPLRLFRFMLLAALPFGIAAYLVDDTTIFLGCFFVLCALVPAQQLSSATMQLVAPPVLRGRLIGLYTAVVGIVSAAIGPVIVASLTQFVFKDEAKLGLSLLSVIIVCLATAIVLLTLALKPLREAAERNAMTSGD
jgi:MFS family permease